MDAEYVDGNSSPSRFGRENEKEWHRIEVVGVKLMLEILGRRFRKASRNTDLGEVPSQLDIESVLVADRNTWVSGSTITPGSSRFLGGRYEKEPSILCNGLGDWLCYEQAW